MHHAFHASPLSCLESLKRGGARGAGYVQKEWSREESNITVRSLLRMAQREEKRGGGAGAARMTDVSHCRDNIPGVSWLMQARGIKGRGRCKLGAGDRLAIQKKRLHGAGRIMASRADDFFRGEAAAQRRDDHALFLFLSSILPRGKVGHDASVRSRKRKSHIIRSEWDADWTETGIEHRHLAPSFECYIFIFSSDWETILPKNYTLVELYVHLSNHQARARASHIFFRKQVYHCDYILSLRLCDCKIIPLL